MIYVLLQVCNFVNLSIPSLIPTGFLIYKKFATISLCPVVEVGIVRDGEHK